MLRCKFLREHCDWKICQFANIEFLYFIGNNFKHLHEVAFRKTAHSSSQYSSSYPAANALDGDVHSTLITLKENGPFLTIDLGKKFKVKRIDVYNRKDCCGRLYFSLMPIFLRRLSSLSINSLFLFQHAFNSNT